MTCQEHLADLLKGIRHINELEVITQTLAEGFRKSLEFFQIAILRAMPVKSYNDKLQLRLRIARLTEGVSTQVKKAEDKRTSGVLQHFIETIPDKQGNKHEFERLRVSVSTDQTDEIYYRV